MYRQLSSSEAIKTIEALNVRIDEIFPSSGLSKICMELGLVAKECQDRTNEIRKPNKTLRIIVASVISLSLLFMFYSISLLDISFHTLRFSELVQVAEAGLNTIILIGAAIFFLVTFENRIKRSRSIKALHELRAITHVIDMHQLTKDPTRNVTMGILTKKTPRKPLSNHEMILYLDYCSEMLSLTGKVAALYAQNLLDSNVLSSVNDLENLATGLSRKIWQKIMILHKLNNNSS